jgi:hypothetical protein
LGQIEKIQLKIFGKNQRKTEKEGRSFFFFFFFIYLSPRYFGYYSCRCSYLCIFMSLCSALLLVATITAILVGLLTKTSNSSTTTKGEKLLL